MILVWIRKFQRILEWSFLTTLSGFTYQYLLRLAHIALYTIEASLLSLNVNVLGSCELAAVADGMCHGFCMLFAQPASGILHSVVDLICHCPGVEKVHLSCHDQSHGVCSEVAFIEPLIFASHTCDFWHTFVPDATQRLFISCYSFIWLLSGGYEVFAFSHQRATFCFFWCTTFLMLAVLVLSPSCWCIV